MCASQEIQLFINSDLPLEQTDRTEPRKLTLDRKNSPISDFSKNRTFTLGFAIWLQLWIWTIVHVNTNQSVQIHFEANRWFIVRRICGIIRVIVHLPCEATSYYCCSIWLNLTRTFRSVHFRIHPATSISNHLFSKTPVTQFPCQPYMSMCTMFNRSWVFLSFSILYSSHHSGTR